MLVLWSWFDVCTLLLQLLLVLLLIPAYSSWFMMDRGTTRSRNPRGRGRGRSRGRYNYSRGGSSRSGSRNSRNSVSSSRQGGLSKAIQHLTTLVTDMRSRIDRLERADNGRSPTRYRMDVGARSTTTAPHDRTDRQWRTDLRYSNYPVVQVYSDIPSLAQLDALS